MSKTASKPSAANPNWAVVRSAWSFEPLVRISLRPGRDATASTSAGSRASDVRSMSWTKDRKASGVMEWSSIRPFSVVP